MPFSVKLLFSNIVIVSCVLIGKRFPSLGGLIAAMPLTTLIVLIWLYSDSGGDGRVVTSFVEGVLFGIVPTVLFFVVALITLRRGVPFVPAVALSFAAWLVGAAVHQLVLK